MARKFDAIISIGYRVNSIPAYLRPIGKNRTSAGITKIIEVNPAHYRTFIYLNSFWAKMLR